MEAAAFSETQMSTSLHIITYQNSVNNKNYANIRIRDNVASNRK
jgi:hypothetical protein